MSTEQLKVVIVIVYNYKLWSQNVQYGILDFNKCFQFKNNRLYKLITIFCRCPFIFFSAHFFKPIFSHIFSFDRATLILIQRNSSYIAKILFQETVHRRAAVTEF